MATKPKKKTRARKVASKPEKLLIGPPIPMSRFVRADALGANLQSVLTVIQAFSDALQADAPFDAADSDCDCDDCEGDDCEGDDPPRSWSRDESGRYTLDWRIVRLNSIARAPLLELGSLAGTTTALGSVTAATLLDWIAEHQGTHHELSRADQRTGYVETFFEQCGVRYYMRTELCLSRPEERHTTFCLLEER